MAFWSAETMRQRLGSGEVVSPFEPGRVKYGAGINVEQELGGGARAFVRAGWNEGRNGSGAPDTTATGGPCSCPCFACTSSSKEWPDSCISARGRIPHDHP